MDDMMRRIYRVWRILVRTWRIVRGTALLLLALVVVADDLRVHVMSRARRAEYLRVRAALQVRDVAPARAVETAAQQAEGR